jgi:hypothetical protein
VETEIRLYQDRTLITYKEAKMARLSRKYAIWTYALFVALTVLASIETYNRGVGFHIIIFSTYAAVFAAGGICAYRYNAFREKKMLKICTWIAVLNLCVCVFLFFRVDLSMLVRDFAIKLAMLMWFRHRIKAVSILMEENHILKESGLV